MTKRLPADLFQAGLQLEELSHFSREERPNVYIRLLYQLGSSEDEFIARSYAEWMKELLERHRRDKTSSGNDKGSGLKWELFEAHVNYLNRDPEWFTIYAVPPEQQRQLRRERIELIQEALDKGIPLPLGMLEEYPEILFSKARLVGAHQAARANFSGEMDDSLLNEYGCWLRRQDGKQVLPAERDEIRAALDEIRLALGDLSDLFRATRLTVIHTSGKGISGESRRTYGLYNYIYGTVVVGRADAPGQNNLSGLAHELVGHWLDHISAPPRMWLVKLLKIKTEATYSPHTLTTAFLDACLRCESSIYPGLLAAMNPIQSRIWKGLMEFFTPSEVFARLAEQYVAYRISRKKKAGLVSIQPIASYFDRPGYWCRPCWQQWVRELAQEQIQARLWMARKRYGSGPHPSLRVSRTYTRAFPWAEGLDLLFLRFQEMRERQR